MGFKEYEEYDGVGLANLIKNKEVSIYEIKEEAINRIEKFNPIINAVITKMYESAENHIESKELRGPFAGVPMLIKDIFQTYAGVRLTMGSKLLKDYVPNIDSEYVTRLKETGVSILGKTNVPEFALMGITEPDYFHPTKNPWNIKYTPGGSSGGSAAAVASRMVPIASGNDGGGSIRIPASCCGLFGLKPSRGRTPNGPTFGEAWMGLVVEHVLTRSVRDSAFMLDLTQGTDIGDPYEIKPPEIPYIKAIEIPPKKLKIAFSIDAPIGGSIHPECKKAVLDTVNLLQDLGHHVEEKTPNIDFLALARSYIIMMFAETAFMLKNLQNILNKKIKMKDIERTTWIIGKLGEIIPIREASEAKFLWDNAARIMGRFHQLYDIYMTPTMAYPPAKIGTLKPSFIENSFINIISTLHLESTLKSTRIVEKMAYKQLSRLPFTQLANQTGQPAMSVPLYWTKNNLPIGVHFMSKFGNENILLQLAKELEDTKQWFEKKPKL